jgi:small subunit ribosomal protein S20
MAHHLSAKKRIRQSIKRTEDNKYNAKTTRTAVKSLRKMSDKKAAIAEMPKVFSLLDKLTKKKVIHKNKAANLKSKLAKHVNSL